MLVRIPRDRAKLPLDPAAILDKYLLAKPEGSILFPGINGSRIKQQAITNLIRRRMSQAGIDGNFSSHSLRIGGAMLACQQGKSELEIRALGGWKTSAIFQYVRDVEREF